MRFDFLYKFRLEHFSFFLEEFSKISWIYIGLVQRLTTDWTVRESNASGGGIFGIRPERPWGPPSLLYNGNWVSFPGVERPKLGANHPPPSNAGVKESVELNLYFSSRPSWPVLGWTLYTGLHVKCPLFLSDFNQIRIFSTDFRRVLKYQTSWKSVHWEPSCCMRTDKHEKTNSRFSQCY